MKPSAILFYALLIPIFASLFIQPRTGTAKDLTGTAIIEEQQARHVPDNESTRIALTLIDRKGKEKHQEMVIYSSKKEGRTRALIQYHAPANIRGVGLLTWKQGQGKEDDQWLYMSASRMVKRIAGGCRKNQFMGTDLSFEDLRPENMDRHTYTLAGEENFGQKPCWKVESLPVSEQEGRDSGYGKRMLWVDQSSYFTLKIEFFDPHGRHVKTARFEDVRPMGGKVFRSFKTTWTRHRHNTSTIMAYRDIDLETRLRDIMFTQNYMKRPLR